MLRKYCDMHVATKYSGGQATVADVVKRAEMLGLDTIVLLESISSTAELDALKNEVSLIDTPVNVLFGVEIRAAKVADIKKFADKFREKVDVLGVYGGELDVNRAALEDPRIDILTHPELGRKDSGIDHVMMKLASVNNVAIELNFREYLHSYRKVRSHVLSHMIQNVMLAEKYGARIVAASGADNVWDMRAGRELASLSYLAGLDREMAVKSVSDVPMFMVSKTREILGGGER